KAVEQYRVYFKDKGIFENVVYENTEYVLKELKKHGKKIILATSKPEEFAIRILKHFNLFEYFDAVGGASMDGTRSKKGDVIKYALEKGGITDTKNAVMVGDRKHDVLGANENGIDSVGVIYGYGSFEELSDAGATYVFDKITDILNIIL
ncbi:MAG: HAD-IA family hydrolase, partial [Clostridia bacterium]|nr:HAD-IA family hydrolase [Clostridia bacterium]